MRPLTAQEIELGASRVKGWGPRWRRDILEMESNEAAWVIGLAALLDARPENGIEPETEVNAHTQEALFGN